MLDEVSTTSTSVTPSSRAPPAPRCAPPPSRRPRRLGGRRHVSPRRRGERLDDHVDHPVGGGSEVRTAQLHRLAAGATAQARGHRHRVRGRGVHPRRELADERRRAGRGHRVAVLHQQVRAVLLLGRRHPLDVGDDHVTVAPRRWSAATRGASRRRPTPGSPGRANGGAAAGGEHHLALGIAPSARRRSARRPRRAGWPCGSRRPRVRAGVKYVVDTRSRPPRGRWWPARRARGWSTASRRRRAPGRGPRARRRRGAARPWRPRRRHAAGPVVEGALRRHRHLGAVTSRSRRCGRSCRCCRRGW